MNSQSFNSKLLNWIIIPLILSVHYKGVLCTQYSKKIYVNAATMEESAIYQERVILNYLMKNSSKLDPLIWTKAETGWE